MSTTYKEALLLRAKTFDKRNQDILTRWAMRVPLHIIGEEFGLSKQRISQIIKGFKNGK